MPEAKAVVVIPTLNERETIGKIIPLVLAQQDRLPSLEVDVLIVDGCSTDGTIDFVSSLSHEDARVHILIVPKRGLGLALLQAYEYAITEVGASYVGQMDADLSHDPTHLPELFTALMEGHDLAIGSRYVEGGGTVDWPVTRRLQSAVANRYASFMSGHPEVREWTSGYRAFTADLYRRLSQQAIAYDDYTLMPALVLEALRVGARVREVPITFVNRKWGKSKLPLVRYTFHLLKHFAAARLAGERDAGPWPVSVPE
jgi:dolichol-phosphate mannosyltransferase